MLLSHLKCLQVVRVLLLSLNATTLRAFALCKSISLTIKQCWETFTLASKYYESIHFLSKLYKSLDASILIHWTCYNNCFCPDRIDILVVNSHCSCSKNFEYYAHWLLFCRWRILLTDEALLDTRLFELFNLLSFKSTSLRCCRYCLFLLSSVPWCLESFCLSCFCDEIRCSLAELEIKVISVEVSSVLLLPYLLHLFVSIPIAADSIRNQM